MLYQGKDDNTWVILTKSINTIRVFFGREGDLPAGGEVDSDVMDLRISTKVVVEDTDAGKRDDSEVSTASSLKVPGDPGTSSISATETEPTPPEDKRKTRISSNNLRSSFR